MRSLSRRARRPAAGAPRRDPAPSRWAYRLHRLWLTPGFRALIHLGIPVLVLVALIGVFLSNGERRAALAESAAAMRTAFQERPEFMVRLVAIDGASPVLAESIRAALALDLPRSSFDINLEAARARVEGFDAVARAELRILTGGSLQVSVTERLPVVVWRTREALWLLDRGGHRVAAITARVLRADLPLIAGEGADAVVPEALDLLAAAGPLLPRLRGLVRVGERRWDVVLDRDQRLLLPAEAPVRALERIIALDQAEGLLARDLTAIDLRNERRTVLRLTPEAAVTLRATFRPLTSESSL